MKRNWLDSIVKMSCLLPMIALLAFGCASQKPAATIQPAPNATDDYLAYVLATKKTYLGNWVVGPNVAVPTGTVIVKAKVTIARDGTVESAQILQPSDNQPINESVRQTLDRVKTVQPFAADARDERRTFVIDFQLKPKAP
jgi:TonB family protein